ncbi:PREDICTED: uncharacterized protein LOC108558407 [Nicrophorus vespilloides]|uniref:Uncharacterized protein LOC108558407 n=1 Tax=Nicrophorus vespilloides TaxID=110193 RepID=A0ABM1M8A4_NICVS|nr:PREDICTED: uncharacterized protein LOC108558407 [Nicrophorus vespilloides]
MAVDINTFASMQKKDYIWPYPKPLMLKPSQPPVKTKPLNYFVATLVEPYCHCDAHLYDPQLKRYEKLAEKEKQLHQELIKLNEQIATLSNEILDHPCDTDDDKLKTTYQIDYTKRGLNITRYRKLMPAIESPVGVPVKGTGGLANAYRDPTSFRYSVFNRPVIDPCPPVSYAIAPENFDTYFKALTGRTEYQDTISKIGLSVIKSRQQYSQPLPSSRRRFGDTAL